jgi:hypothetical protein
MQLGQSQPYSPDPQSHSTCTHQFVLGQGRGGVHTGHVCSLPSSVLPKSASWGKASSCHQNLLSN